MVNQTKLKMEQTSTEPKISERKILKIVGVSSSTYKYKSKREGKDRALTKAIYEKVAENPRYGYRKVCALLQEDNWDVGPKLIYRIWRREGLKVYKRSRKQRSKGNKGNGCRVLKALRKNDIWAMDFVHDSTSGGSSLRFLTIVDEFTKESLSFEVGLSFPSEKVVAILRKLFKERGFPKFIRTDNGKEFVSKILKQLLKMAGVKHLLIAPASPWDNGICESFNSIFRDDFLNMNIFGSLREARRLSIIWHNEYNERRPHGSLGQITPASYSNSLPDGEGLATLIPLHQVVTLGCMH